MSGKRQANKTANFAKHTDNCIRVIVKILLSSDVEGSPYSIMDKLLAGRTKRLLSKKTQSSATSHEMKCFAFIAQCLKECKLPGENRTYAEKFVIDNNKESGAMISSQSTCESYIRVDGPTFSVITLLVDALQRNKTFRFEELFRSSVPTQNIRAWVKSLDLEKILCDTFKYSARAPRLKFGSPAGVGMIHTDRLVNVDSSWILPISLSVSEASLQVVDAGSPDVCKHPECCARKHLFKTDALKRFSTYVRAKHVHEFDLCIICIRTREVGMFINTSCCRFARHIVPDSHLSVICEPRGVDGFDESYMYGSVPHIPSYTRKKLPDGRVYLLQNAYYHKSSKNCRPE